MTADMATEPDCEPTWTLDLRGQLPGLHTPEQLDLHGQGLTWHEIHTMQNVKTSEEYL